MSRRFVAARLLVVFASVSTLLIAASRSVPAAQTPSSRQPATLLDSSGNMASAVTDSELASWRKTIGDKSSSPSDAAQAHIALGEYLLGHDKQPDAAIHEFDAAALLPSADKPLIGLAQYDKAIAQFAEGAYQDATDAFLTLDTPKTALPGYDRRTAALWLRHSAACAGYHRQHAELGIPEPPKLDPLCGAAALATYLHSIGMPYDKKAVVSKCHITGEGDNLQDLVDAGKQLGIAVHTVQANDRGLIQLPKPLIAHVEGDHFIAIVEANSKGVAYLCSDCGPWPGGRVNLTWAQWHALQPDAYGAMVRPGSSWDKALGEIAAEPEHAKLLVAANGSLAGIIPTVAALAALIKGDVVGTHSGNLICTRYFNTPCPPCAIECPTDGSGGGSCDGSGNQGNGSSGPPAPDSGDPVNLASGEEEYAPDPDLVVYNPTGPWVTWQRGYRSLGNMGQHDYGDPWVIGYDFYVSTNYAGPSNPTTISFNFPNGASFSPNSAVPPSSSSAPIHLALPTGYALLIDYCYSGASGDPYYFVVTRQDHSKWTFQNLGILSNGNKYSLYSIADRFGNLITFHYDSNHRISSIQQGTSGTTLLTVNRDSNGYTSSVADCYSRSVYYTVDPTGVWGGPELTHVSQIVATGASSRPDRYQFGYTNVYGPAPTYSGTTLDVGPAFLNTITVPSATGSGTDTATLYYGSYCFLGKVVDGNGNTRTYTSTDASGNASAPSNYTKVAYADSGGTTAYSYISGYDANMSASNTRDFGNGITSETTAFDATDPYRPATVYDGDSLYSVRPNHSVTLTSYGSDSPTSGTWKILNKAGTVVASSGTPNSWTVSVSGSQISIGAPTGATVGAHYEVKSSSASPHSAYFDVYATSKGATSYTWDAFANMLTMTDPRGTTTTYHHAYSAFELGDVDYVSQGSKAATSYTYTASGTYKNGLVTKINSPVPGTVGGSGSVETDFTYDESAYVGSGVALGLLTTEVDPGNSTYATITSNWNYISDSTNDSNGDPSGSSYSQSAAWNEPLVFINGDGKKTHYRYDSRGNCAVVVDANDNKTVYTYNLADQITSIAQYTPWVSGTPHRTLIDTVYYNYLNLVDSSSGYYTGPLKSVQLKDGSGTLVREADYTYGHEGELLSESAYDVAGATSHTVSSYTYDPIYRVKTITDGRGNVTTYTYDANTGNLKLVQYPGAGTNTTGSDTINLTAFDADHSLLTRIDGNSVETDYSYDDADSLLTAIAYPSSTAINASIGYDSYSRLSSLTDGVFLVNGSNPGEAFSYDDLDNVTGKSVNYASTGTALANLQVSYTYNSDNSLATMVVPTAYGSGSYTTGTFSYGYDDVGRTISETAPSSDSATWAYQDNDWLSGQLSKNAAGSTIVDTTYTYDARGELTDLKNYKSGRGSVWSEFGGTSSSAMAYDTAGNRMSMPVTETDHTAYSGTTDYFNGGTPGYDYKNELTYETSTRNSSYTNTFAYDTAGNFTTLRGSTVATANSDNQLTATGYSYDGNGNPTTYASTAMAYDPENRLTKVGTSGSYSMQAGYGADGLRAWRIDASGAKIFYLYDGMTPVVQITANGASSGQVNLVNTFGANGLISRNFTMVGDRFYVFDPQGSCAESINSGNTVLTSYLYDAFGDRQANGSTTSDSYGSFGGQYGYWYDSDTGLELLDHRFYDPGNGRFINRDSAGYRGGFDLYRYAINNPSMYVDPLGYFTIGVGIDIGTGGGIGPVLGGGSGGELNLEIDTNGTIGVGYGIGGSFGGIGGFAGIGGHLVLSNSNLGGPSNGGWHVHQPFSPTFGVGAKGGPFSGSLTHSPGSGQWTCELGAGAQEGALVGPYVGGNGFDGINVPTILGPAENSMDSYFNPPTYYGNPIGGGPGWGAHPG